MSENQNSSREQGVEKYFFRASAADFKKMPGGNIAYWLSENARNCYEIGGEVQELFPAKLGMRTGDNSKWLRLWHEVSQNGTSLFSINAVDAESSGKKWFPYNKGGDFRKWYGNNEFLVFWKENGFDIKKETLEKYPQLSWDNLGWKITNEKDFFRKSLTWSFVSSSYFGVRCSLGGAIFDVGGSSTFPSDVDYYVAAGYLCSKVAFEFLKASNPTLNFQVVNVNELPWIDAGSNRAAAEVAVRELVSLSKEDWDSYETSWDFTNLPLLHSEHRPSTLKASYQKLRAHWREMTLKMQRLEQENNRIFIDAYGLQDELKPEVPLSEITLTCNPHYRYGGDKSEDELEAMLLADTMRELVSYAVGCMFGRYSLDKPGLILANQGEMLADYLAQVPQPSFPADGDNVIPLLDGDWFADDITLRFRQFLRVAFGEAHYEDNLAFIEQALNIKGKRNYGLRDYFLGEFYTDHVKRYKKRPIYWLFSSPKGSFNALIYMHRYRPDTVSVVLKYLRDYRQKLIDEKDRQDAVSISPASSQGDKTRAQKEVDRLAKVLAELEDYERDVLYPLATEQKHIDLDDGVKKNYVEFGQALKKIPGLDAKEEE